MRQFNGPTARPQPADRNALTVAYTYGLAATAPHAGTVRATYTCPANRRALITNISNALMRQTAAAPVGTIESYARITNVAAVAARVIELTCIDNTVGYQQSQSLAQSATLLPTETVTHATSDNSTGGTAYYVGAFVGTEYDA